MELLVRVREKMRAWRSHLKDARASLDLNNVPIDCRCS